MNIPSNVKFSSFRVVALTAASDVFSTGPVALMSYRLRNSATTPVYLNFYDGPFGANPAGVGGAVPVAREGVAGAAASNIAQTTVHNNGQPIRVYSNGLWVSPQTTDTDNAAVAGTIFVELQYVPIASLGT